jgi:quercetin dioxygenase-like cupin family protein
LKKSNINAKFEEKKANPNYFTGHVTMKEIMLVIKSKEHNIYHVTFTNGARTKLHTHSGGQTLIVTQGTGSLEMYSKLGNGKSKFKIKKLEKTRLREGDIVYIPAKKLHTHGSVGKKTFSHIAINSRPLAYKEVITTWYESDFKSRVTKILE